MTRKPKISYRDFGRLEPPAGQPPEPSAAPTPPTPPTESAAPAAAVPVAPPVAPAIPAETAEFPAIARKTAEARQLDTPITSETAELPAVTKRGTVARPRTSQPEEPAAPPPPPASAPAPVRSPAPQRISEPVSIDTIRPTPRSSLVIPQRVVGASFFGGESQEPVQRYVRRETAGLRFRDRARLGLGVAELLLFRVGGELFGVELSAVEEAIDRLPVHTLPEMPPSMLGVFMLRGAPVALHQPGPLLGTVAHLAETVLVFRGTGRRLALAIDDVDDVMTADLAEVRDAPGTDAADGILLGVARRDRDLIGVLDAEALLAACRTSDAAVEAA